MQEFFFEAIVTVNVTGMLVITTMFISVSNSLPKTAYIKMVDLWLIFSQLIPFFELILHTYMQTLREKYICAYIVQILYILRDDDLEGMEINHQGTKLAVKESDKQTNRNKVIGMIL